MFPARSGLVLVVCLCLIFGCAVLTAFAQSITVGDAPKNAQAISVAQRALATMGASNLLPSQTAQATGTLTLHGNSDIVFPVVLKSLGTQQLRTELTTSKGLRLFIVNGGHGTIRQPDGSVRQLLDDNMLVQRVNHIPALSLLGEYLQKNVSLDYVGSSLIDGVTVDIVAVSLYSGETAKDAQSLQSRTRILYYIDTRTALVNRIDRSNYAENDPNDEQKLETRFSDYKPVNGVLVPFRQQTLADGRPYLDLVLSSVVFGVTLQPSDFWLDQ